MCLCALKASFDFSLLKIKWVQYNCFKNANRFQIAGKRREPAIADSLSRAIIITTTLSDMLWFAIDLISLIKSGNKENC